MHLQPFPFSPGGLCFFSLLALLDTPQRGWVSLVLFSRPFLLGALLSGDGSVGWGLPVALSSSWGPAGFGN